MTTQMMSSLVDKHIQWQIVSTAMFKGLSFFNDRINGCISSFRITYPIDLIYRPFFFVKFILYVLCFTILRNYKLWFRPTKTWNGIIFIFHFESVIILTVYLVAWKPMWILLYSTSNIFICLIRNIKGCKLYHMIIKFVYFIFTSTFINPKSKGIFPSAFSLLFFVINCYYLFWKHGWQNLGLYIWNPYRTGHKSWQGTCFLLCFHQSP